MDSRVRDHARTVVDHSLGLDGGEDVVVDAHALAEDFVTALCAELGRVGANPLVISDRLGSRYRRAYLRHSDGDFETPEHHLALLEAADAYVTVKGEANVSADADVDGEVQSAYDRARQPLTEARLSTTWCLTQHPTASAAQLAGESTEGYEDFVYDAVGKDWAAQRAFQEPMAEILDGGSEVRIVAGDRTDLTMSIEGNVARNDYGRRNLPGGEVFTAPRPESVEGTVVFDYPVYQRGREIVDAELVFEDGAVVDYAAAKNEATLGSILDTDAGASRVGELGVGMNRAIDQFTYNMLFDEKMGDTVHLAVGRAYPECVGEGNEANESAVHVDMLLDVSEDARLEVDGEVVQRNGTFRFEESFAN